ncbi:MULTISPECIES: hypothetical protein [Pseudomonas]|jgi:hypothetical protein
MSPFFDASIAISGRHHTRAGDQQKQEAGAGTWCIAMNVEIG